MTAPRRRAVDRSGQARYSPGVPEVRNDERTNHAEPPAEDDAVPKLPRGRGLRLSGPQLVRIVGTVFLLVFVVVTQRPCSTAVSKFVTSFGDQGSAAAVMPRPGSVDVPAGSAAGSAGRADGPAGSGSAGSGSAAPGVDDYEHLRPGMTDDEIKAVIDRARIKAANRRAVP